MFQVYFIRAFAPDELIADEKQIHQMLVNMFFPASFLSDGFVRDTFFKNAASKFGEFVKMSKKVSPKKK